MGCNKQTLNSCIIFSEIVFTKDDREALFRSDVSDNLVLQIRNHNDIYKEKCQKR